VQRQSFARAYIEADRPADALKWLQDGWGHLEGSRLGLLAEALEKLGRFEESVADPSRDVRGNAARTSTSTSGWQHLPEAART
jgi:hypothetical protein